MPSPDNKPYKGRFAPTPSGPAHQGTLLAATGSYLQAHSNQGEWHVRIDDIDPPREMPGSADSILRTLERYGLHWDGPVVYQSRRHDHYQAALHTLQTNNLAYDCGCSRKEIEPVSRTGPNGMIYPGTCRNGLPAGKTARAIRLLAQNRTITFVDRIQGEHGLNIEQQIGDYVIRRADGPYAYHLATVVDDALDGFTQIVRSCDLLNVTPQQIYLQQQLGYPTPDYAHLPLLVDSQGNKLCKRSGARAVDEIDRRDVLRNIFNALALPVDMEIINSPNEILWAWAIEQRDMDNIAAATIRPAIRVI